MSRKQTDKNGIGERNRGITMKKEKISISDYDNCDGNILPPVRLLDLPVEVNGSAKTYTILSIYVYRGILHIDIE